MKQSDASLNMKWLVLLPKDKLWHQLSCPLALNKQKMWYADRHNRVSFSHKEENMPSAGKCTELETQKERLHSLSNDP